MTIYAVIRKSDGQQVYEYQSDAPVEWHGMEFATHEHMATPDPVTPEPAPVDPTQWRIYVGAFFDRFGAYKIPILASGDLVVQALINDASVRKYIDLYGRRDELVQMIGLLQTKGFAIDATAILDVVPTAEETWHD